jgi:hypothetical protein
MCFNSIHLLYYFIDLQSRKAKRKLRARAHLRLVREKSQRFCGDQVGIYLALILASFCVAPGIYAQAPEDSIEVPINSTLLLEAKGTGVQIYGCVNGRWVLQAPDAQLLDGQGEVIGSHYAGPTWRLNDGSWVKGNPVGKQASPDGESVPWLLLEAVHGAGRLATVEFIQRTDTHGGNAPAGACGDGAEIRVPYTATYSFYKATR